MREFGIEINKLKIKIKWIIGAWKNNNKPFAIRDHHLPIINIIGFANCLDGLKQHNKREKSGETNQFSEKVIRVIINSNILKLCNFLLTCRSLLKMDDLWN